MHALVLGALALLCCLKFPELELRVPAAGAGDAAGGLAGGERRAGARRGRSRARRCAIVLPLLLATLASSPRSCCCSIQALGADAWPVLTAVACAGPAGSGAATAPGARAAISAPGPGCAGLMIVLAAVALTMFAPGLFRRRCRSGRCCGTLLDADTGRARWMLQPDSKRDPPQLALRGPEAASAASAAACRPATIAGIAPRRGAAARLCATGTAGAGRHGASTAAACTGCACARMRGAPEIELAAARWPGHRSDTDRRGRAPAADQVRGAPPITACGCNSSARRPRAWSWSSRHRARRISSSRCWTAPTACRPRARRCAYLARR